MTTQTGWVYHIATFVWRRSETESSVVLSYFTNNATSYDDALLSNYEHVLWWWETQVSNLTMRKVTHSENRNTASLWMFRLITYDDNIIVLRQVIEHDPQATLYPIICTHHGLHSNNTNKNPAFLGYIWNSWQGPNHRKTWQQWEYHKGVLYYAVN